MTSMQKDFLAIAACFLVCALSVGLIDGIIGSVPCFIVGGVWYIVNAKKNGWMAWVPAVLFAIVGLIKLGWPS